MRYAYYQLNQALPPAHWYQKRVGWYGKLMFVGSLLIATSVGYGLYYMHTHTQGGLVSRANAPLTKVQRPSVTPLAEPKPQNIVDVQSVLDDWAQDHPNQKISVVARSLDGPSFDAQLNASKTYSSTSFYKLFLLTSLYRQIPAEHLRGITVDADGNKSMAACADLMLRLSNDVCAQALSDYVDWGKATRSLKQDGFGKTSFNNDGMTVKTSAEDTASLLQKLDGNLLVRTAKDSMQRSMREQYFRKGIPTGCPGCIVADRTDGSNGVIHDAAIVRYAKGTYVLTILTDSGSYDDVSRLAGKIQQKIIDTTKR